MAGLVGVLTGGILVIGGIWWMNYASDLSESATWLTGGAEYNEFHILGILLAIGGVGLAAIGSGLAALGFGRMDRRGRSVPGVSPSMWRDGDR